MNTHKVGAFLAFIIISGALMNMMQTNWKKVDDENNAFAKDCNNRGGVATFDSAARQCIGATIPSRQHPVAN